MKENYFIKNVYYEKADDKFDAVAGSEYDCNNPEGLYELIKRVGGDRYVETIQNGIKTLALAQNDSNSLELIHLMPMVYHSKKVSVTDFVNALEDTFNDVED